MPVWIIFGLRIDGDSWVEEVRHDSLENAELRAEFFMNEFLRNDDADCRFYVQQYDSKG
jgi:hypothetical protein